MMFTVRILFDNVSSLWQSPLHGNRPIVNNNRNGLYHQFVKLSIKKYKKCLEAANFYFYLILALSIQKALSFTQIPVAFLHISPYITRFSGSETSLNSPLTVVV